MAPGIRDLAYRHEDRRLRSDGVIPGYPLREWTVPTVGALPPSAPRPNRRVARLLHEAGIRSAGGADRARAAARQHRSSVYREPVTPEVERSQPRRQIRGSRGQRALHVVVGGGDTGIEPVTSRV